MNKKNLWFKLLFITILGSLFIQSGAASLVSGEPIKYIPEIEEAFKKALKIYKSKDYSKSTLVFEKLTEFQPVHQRITICHLMYGKSLMKQGQYRQAILEFREFINAFPESRYVENGRFEIATSFFLLGHSLAATREFLWIFEHGLNSQLIQKSKFVAEYLIDTVLSLSELQNLLGEFPGEKSSGLLTLKLAEKQVATGNANNAINLIIDFLNENPNNEYLEPLETYLNKIRLNAQPNLKLGVILPLTSGYMEDGKNILTGIRFAVKEFEDQYQQKVELIVHDSGSNVVKAIKAAQLMVQDENILAILGELESDITAAVAAVTTQSGVPLIAPIASKSGIASISENTFQANSDLYERGRQIALYAVENLNMKTFATLAPADEYGQEMTDGFTATIEKLGGSIVAPPKWYFQGSKNLSRQLKSIRTVGFELLKEDSAWVRQNALLIAKATIDTFLVPITSIDGLFCPVYTEDIQYIGPQCAALNLRAQLLGGDYWFDREVLRNSQKYVNGAVFVSDYFVDEYDPEYRRFRTNFRIKMGHDFGRMEAFGYDAMKAVLFIIKEHNIGSRFKLRDKLETLQDFQGVKGEISWRGNQRINNEVNILQYDTGLIRKLK